MLKQVFIIVNMTNSYNYAKNGASIQAIESTLEIDNSTFISDKEIGWGLIYAYDTKTSIKNTVFANMTSKYATAIYCEKNSLLLNLIFLTKINTDNSQPIFKLNV